MAQAVAGSSLDEKVLSSAALARRRRYFAVVIGGVIFIGLWWLVAVWVGAEFRLPSPPRVLKEMSIILAGDFWTQFWASILRVFAGFVTAVLLGSPIGYLMGRSPYWKNFLQAPVLIAGAIPGITYAVMMLVVFRISFFGPVVAIGLFSMPYVALNVAEGVGGVDRKLIDMSRAYGCSERQVLRQVVLPSVLPFVFAGVRMSFSLAWKVGQLTEVFGASRGIGFQIRRNFQLFNSAAVLAWVLLFIVFMLFLERLVLLRIERRLFRWRQTERD